MFPGGIERGQWHEIAFLTYPEAFQKNKNKKKKKINWALVFRQIDEISYMLDDTGHAVITIQCKTHLAGEVLYLH